MGRTDREPQGLAEGLGAFQRRHGAAQVTDESPARHRARIINEKLPLQAELTQVKHLIKVSRPASADRHRLEGRQMRLVEQLQVMDRQLAQMKGRTSEARDTVTVAWPRMFVEVARHTLTEELFADLRRMTSEIFDQWAEEDMKQFRELPAVNRVLKGVKINGR